jgi:hypothetical protein
LTATIQGAYPLPLYLVPHPVELSLAVVQPKILVEAPQHPLQMLLLLPSSPVSGHQQTADPAKARRSKILFRVIAASRER